MVFKAAISLVVRLSRAFAFRPFKPLLTGPFHRRPHWKKTHEIYSKQSPRFSLFPSIYRSMVISSNGQNLSNLMPLRATLNELKRRLFFAAPSSSRLLFGLLGYSFVQQVPVDSFRLDDTFNKIGNLLSKTITVDQISDENEKYSRESLDDYELGRLLGSGCNAAVYEARIQTPSHSTIKFARHSSENSDIRILSNSSFSEHVDDNDEELTLTEARQQLSSTMIPQSTGMTSDILPAGKFNLAIKMLFNYSIQSNAEAIEKSMEKELIPLHKRIYHPNVVRMYSSFVDLFPLLNEAHEYYPMAIPTRLSPDSYGRNKTLFIVMRRYDLTLRQYIDLSKPDNHQRLLLFTQLLEALLYLHNHSIVHRDLKSDNLLICVETGELVVADFGCALYQPPDLKVAYQTDEICKGGNIALMAPEISTCKASSESYLDYSKADLWASGTLFYEFFSKENPFYHGLLRSDNYDDENLPTLSSTTSIMIERLVHSMLRKNPEKRPSISLVTNCFHLCLWFDVLQSKNELYQSYMWTALKTLFHKRSLSHVELNLKKLFYERQTCKSLYQAQDFLNRI